MSKIKQISRHPIKNIHLISKKINFYNEGLEEDLDYLQKNPKNLGHFSQKILQAVSMAALIELPHEAIINYMQISLSAGLGHFQSTLNPGKTFDIDVGNKKLLMRGVETTAYIDTFRWERLFHLAIILRDKGCRQIVDSIPESLMRQANIKPDDADDAIVSFYKGLYDPKVNIGALLLKAIKACNPNGYEVEREDYLLYIKGAELSLYRSIFSNEPQEYSKYLAEAILDHKKYWGNKERAYNNTGWISYPLIAACVIAHDSKEYPIEVDSPYVPLWLVKHEF